MPYLNGTAEDHKDLLNQFRQFAEGYGVITLPITYAGTGDGAIYKVAAPPPGVSETWTLVCTLGGGHGVATFSVTGSISGAQAAATVGTFYDNGLVEFVIQDGPIDFVISDQFDITVTQSKFIVDSQQWTQERWLPPVGNYSASTFDFPLNAFDNSSGTFTSKIGVTSGILRMDFPDATAFVEYQVQARNVGFDATEAPFNWTLEWSDDGVNWTVEDTRAAQVFTIAETKTFSLTTGRHLYWRFNVSANNGGTDIEFAQFRLRQTGQTLYTTNEWALNLRGQGLSGGDNIYLGFQVSEDELSPYYNWKLYGAIGFDNGAASDTQPGVNTSETRYISNNQLQEFWFFGNGRYLSLTTKQTTDYTSAYCGLLLPYGQPSEYSYPLVLMGGSQVARHYTSTDIRHRMFIDPGENCCIAREPGGTWEQYENYTSSQTSAIKNVWPYNANTNGWEAVIDNITEGLDGTYDLWPCMLISFDEETIPNGRGKNILGEVQDVFYISGSNNSAETIIAVGGDNYIVFQNVFRTEFNNFYAMRIDV